MTGFEINAISNEFKIKDLEEFKKALEKYNISDFFKIFEHDGKNFAYLVTENDCCGLCVCDENKEFGYDDFCNLIQKHMEDDEIVFVSTIGNEKMLHFSADCSIITKAHRSYKNFFDSIAKEYNRNSVF